LNKEQTFINAFFTNVYDINAPHDMHLTREH